jgi:uncharacterized protein YxjI
MPRSYLMSRKWSLASRFTITDETGAPQFEVQGKSAFSSRLSITDSSGALAASISGRALSSRYEIQAGGLTTVVQPRGLFGQRYEITSPAGQLEARGNFSQRTYTVTRGGAVAATITQQRSFREKFAVEIADGEDPALLLAVVLTIEVIRDRRRAAAG